MTLSWLANVEDEEIYGDIQYQVEYNRETWDIWLKVRIIPECILQSSKGTLLERDVLISRAFGWENAQKGN